MNNKSTTSLRSKIPFNSLSEFYFIKKLGKGAFSRVYLVRHKNGKKYALKHIQYNSLHKTDKNNVQNEIKIHKRITHPNIVQFYNYFFDNGDLFLVLEYCKDGNLFQTIHDSEKKLSKSKIEKIFKQIVNGIDYLHKNKIILRDLKPENIVLDGEKAKLCDFGWAVEIDNFSWRKKQAGTFAYMSPESILGKIQGYSSDIWSLGVLLYEMKTKEEVFEEKNSINQIRIMKKNFIGFDSSFSRDEKNLVRKMLKYKPEERVDIGYIKNYFSSKSIEKMASSKSSFLQNSLLGSYLKKSRSRMFKVENNQKKKNLRNNKQNNFKKITITQSCLHPDFKNNNSNKIKKYNNYNFVQSNVYKDSLATRTTQQDSINKSFNSKKNTFLDNSSKKFKKNKNYISTNYFNNNKKKLYSSNFNLIENETKSYYKLNQDNEYSKYIIIK